jgi:prepilin peptidase CpaA
MFQDPLILIFPLAMAFAASMDLFTMTIPNRISILLVVSFFLVVLIVSAPWGVVWRHLMIAGIVLVVAIAMFALGWLGGGDAKLLAAASLWLGPDLFVSFLLNVAIVGGILALVLLRYRGIAVLPSWLASERWALRLHEKNGGIPYGIALGGGAMFVYPQTHWFFALAY